jgi:transposase-like protein
VTRREGESSVARERRLRDPSAAAEFLERLRWPDGPVCPHCGEHEQPPYRLKSERKTRRLWKCRVCRRQFTVTVGTRIESTHLALNLWLRAFEIVRTSSEGTTASQLERALRVAPKTARYVRALVTEALSEAAGESSASSASDASEDAPLRVMLRPPHDAA